MNEKAALAASLNFTMCPHGSPPIPARDAKFGDDDKTGGEAIFFQSQWPDDVSEEVSRAAEKQVFGSAHAKASLDFQGYEQDSSTNTLKVALSMTGAKSIVAGIASRH